MSYAIAKTGQYVRMVNGPEEVGETEVWSATAPVPSEPVSASLLCEQIDSAADTARALVVGDPIRAVEYERAADEARTFAEAGYPADSVPRTVSAWAINGRNARQAADSILAEAAAYTEVLYRIREIRLQGKELVRAQLAARNVALAEQSATEAIADIDAVITGVGNAQATT